MTNHYRLSDPSDVRDLGQQIAAWRAAGNPKADAWAEQPPRPTPDAMWIGGQWVTPPPSPVPQAISPRQARLWLLQHGIGPAQVDAVIASIPDAMTRQTVQIDWEYGLEVQRSSPFVHQLGAAVGLDAAALDEAFREAAAL